MNTIFLQAFVLHSSPYRENSALVDFFTPKGRFRAVLRHARSKSGARGRPFMPLEISLYGKGELKTVRQIDVIAPPYLLQGKKLFSGLYLNELLVRLLPLEDTYPAIFDQYQQTLAYLVSQPTIEPLLRSFEWQLLNELGYGFSLTQTAEGDPIQPDNFYAFSADYGLQAIAHLQSGAFYGRDILAMSEADWSVATALTAAKRLMRQVLAVYLQGRPLVSRELFK